MTSVAFAEFKIRQAVKFYGPESPVYRVFGDIEPGEWSHVDTDTEAEAIAEVSQWPGSFYEYVVGPSEPLRSATTFG